MSKGINRNSLIKNCLANSENLLASAELILSNNGHNPAAYALITLALEEIGKAALLRTGWVEDLAQQRLGSPKRLDDHVFKLMFSLMEVSAQAEKGHLKAFQDIQRFAEYIHNTRVNSTYSPTNGYGKLVKVTKKETSNFLTFTKSRLELEKSYKIRRARKIDRENAQWLVTMFTDEAIRSFAFSKQSVNKLDELKDSRIWMEWVRKEVKNNDEESKRILAQEIARVPDVNDTDSQKWKITMRLCLPLHSVDRKSLDDWNEWAPTMKLRPAGAKGKNELLADLILPASVHVNNLWDVGFNFANRLAIALNIGLMGFVWWEIPQHQSQYYESIKDLEGEPGWSLEVKKTGDFKYLLEKQSLPVKKEQLWRAFQTFVCLPNTENEKPKFRAFSLYSSALNFIGRANVFWPPFYNEAFAYLYLACKAAFEAYQKIEEGETFPDALRRTFDGKLAEDIKLEELIGWGEALTLSKKKAANQEFIRLEHILNFKILCDAFFTRIIQDTHHEKLRERKTNKS